MMSPAGIKITSMTNGVHVPSPKITVVPKLELEVTHLPSLLSLCRDPPLMYPNSL